MTNKIKLNDVRKGSVIVVKDDLGFNEVVVEYVAEGFYDPYGDYEANTCEDTVGYTDVDGYGRYAYFNQIYSVIKF